MSRNRVAINGKTLVLSNLEKDLYPAHGFTKAHILEYYTGMAPFILPHLKDRALTLKRYPEGVERDFFFEKHCPPHRPAWVKTGEVRHEQERMTACLVNDLETLIWVENLASIELHVPLARIDTPDTPTAMVFDLDPGDGANILNCGRVALILRDLLHGMRLEGYAKTSGGKGLHIYVPLNRKEATFAGIKDFSKAVAVIMQKNYPALVTAKMTKTLRKGKVFINWSQNDRKATMICVYSLRARERPVVSFPLSWEELEDLVRQDDPERFHVMPALAGTRIKNSGDTFRAVLERKQRLPYLSR